MDDNEVIPVDFPVIIPRSTYVECLPSGLQYLESLAASAQSLIAAHGSRDAALDSFPVQPSGTMVAEDTSETSTSSSLSGPPAGQQAEGRQDERSAASTRTMSTEQFLLHHLIHRLSPNLSNRYAVQSMMRPEYSLPMAVALKGWEDGLFDAHMRFNEFAHPLADTPVSGFLSSARSAPSDEEAVNDDDSHIEAVDEDEEEEEEEEEEGPEGIPDNEHYIVDAPSGVAHVARMFTDERCDQMNAIVDRYRDSQPQVDYHPQSGNHVRDILHPSMHPYIAAANTDEERDTFDEATLEDRPQLSRVLSGNCVPDCVWNPQQKRYVPFGWANGRGPATDDFARLWRGSRYQWMPSDVRIDNEGKATFISPVNGLNAQCDDDVLHMFESILTKLVPLWEYVLGYTQAAGWHMHHLGLWTENDDMTVLPRSLRNTTIQVVPKIADVELNADGDEYEGVWHVEGLSHEHIAATGIAYLHRDPRLQGGRLLFRRAFLPWEAGYLNATLQQGYGQASPAITAGLVPLGSVLPLQGDLIAFPNSHQHKLQKLQVPYPRSVPTLSASVATSSLPKATRRMVCFFLINPDKRIVSTGDVAVRPSQVLDYATSCRIRLAMMKERAMAKADLNAAIGYNFCEH
jgi:hypothetical protein